MQRMLNTEGVQVAEIARRLDRLSQALERDGVRLAYLFGSALEKRQVRAYLDGEAY